MSMNDLSIKAFSEQLAAKVSVPGGGSAAALTGALAAALGSMVGEFTVGKAKYKDVEPEIIALMKDGEMVDSLSDAGQVILDKTCFYAESGGQVADGVDDVDKLS